MIKRSALTPLRESVTALPTHLPTAGRQGGASSRLARESPARTGAVRYVRGPMKEKKEEELEETKKLFKEGLDKIWRATKKATKNIVKGFKEGYSEEDKKES
jgi:hypothetical protein